MDEELRKKPFIKDCTINNGTSGSLLGFSTYARNLESLGERVTIVNILYAHQ